MAQTMNRRNPTTTVQPSSSSSLRMLHNRSKKNSLPLHKLNSSFSRPNDDKKKLTKHVKAALVMLSLVSLLLLRSSETAAASSQRSLSDGAVVNTDVVVAGSGPAGLTAGLFAARAGLQVLVCGSESGQLSETQRLDNFPSFKRDTGESWLLSTKQQAADAGVQFAQPGLLMNAIQQEKDGTFSVDIGQSSLTTRAIIVATGATGRRLNLMHEDVLWGKSVHSCAICDGSAYHGKTVVVVGGGDAAMDASLLLSRYAKQVILLHRQDSYRASNRQNVVQVLKTRNIQVKTPFVVQQYNVNAEKQLTGVQVKQVNEDTEATIPCHGVFLMIGSTPNTSWLSKTVELESDGLIRLQSATATSVQGIFAAGEVTDNVYRQAITGAAAGAQAAIDAERWLRTRPVPQYTSSAAIQLQQVSSSNAKQQERQAVVEVVDAATGKYGCDLTLKDCIEALVQKYPVVVFSKPSCPYCMRALEALSLEGVHQEPFLHVVNLGAMSNRAKMIQATLGLMTGRRTVPNVFVGGTSIGGGDETTGLRKAGKLRPLLVEAKALVL